MASSDVRVVTGLNNTWSHVFQGANTTWLTAFNQIIRVGNFFNGLQGMSQQMFDSQIPPGSVILSATMQVEARNTSNGVMNLPLSTFDRDTYYSEPLKQPFASFQGSPRRDFWSNAAMGALSTTFTAISGSATAPSNSSWILKQILNWREVMWQLTPTRTGNMTLAFGIWEVHRTGNPAGSCRMRIQGVTTDAYGQKIPDGIDVAVSDDVLCSSIALGPAADTAAFNFNGETLVATTEYFWGLEVDYVADNANHISAHHYNAFATDGQLYHQGSDTGMGWQHFPGNVDLAIGANGVFDVPLATVNWAVPNFVANNAYTTPDLTALVQAQVNLPWYTQDSGILIAAEVPTSGNVFRVYKSAFYPAVDQARLQVTWRDRRVMIT